MGYQVANCSDHDMVRTYEIISLAFGHDHPYIDYMFPKHWTEAGRRDGAKRMLELKQDENTQFLKVVDTETGEMIAQATVITYKNAVPEEANLDGNWWDSEEDKKLAQHFYREMQVPRRQFIQESGGNFICVDVLTVDPRHQRKGAGRLLTKWATDKADQLGLPSSKCAEPLYISAGFVPTKRFWLLFPKDYPQSEPDEMRDQAIWMIRPPQPVPQA